MKKLLFSLMLIAGSSLFAFAGQPKVIALLNKASWCPVCQANGPRFEKDIMPMVMMNKDVQMVMDDLSDDKSKTMSKDMLNKAGIGDFASSHTDTGMLFFIDAKTHQLISEVSLSKSDDDIKAAYQKALTGN